MEADGGGAAELFVGDYADQFAVEIEVEDSVIATVASEDAGGG
jgi:hypothetical protein